MGMEHIVEVYSAQFKKKSGFVFVITILNQI
jgi:hypothetical protein